MAVTEQSRHQLHECLDDVLGSEHATTLMEHLPPVGWADVATKADLEHLAIVLKADLDQRFMGTDKRFMGMDQRFMGMDQRFMGIDQHLMAIELRLDAVDQRFETMEQRFDMVDQRFETMEQRFDMVDQRFDAVDQRFDAVDQRFDAVDQRFEAMEHRFTAIDHQFAAMNQRIEDSVSTLRAEISSMGDSFRTELHKELRLHMLAMLSFGVALAGILLSAVHFL